MNENERIGTARLILRKPADADAEAIFIRYASDREVTKYLSWPRHQSIEDTRQFVAASNAEWNRWPTGPYLIESKIDHTLLGSTGLYFMSPTEAVTGYVLAHDAWGRGYATESLNAMVALARELGVRRLQALCHANHTASAHVLEKCGFVCESGLLQQETFPNIGSDEPQDCRRYVRRLDLMAG